MKVLVTCGTEQFQFNRLIKWAEELAFLNPTSQFVLQLGSSTYVPNQKNIKSVRYVGEEEFKALLKNTDIIIGHCGEGTLLTAQEYKKPFILVPRLKVYKEHVDNHQEELAGVLEAQEVPIATSIEELSSFMIRPYFKTFSYKSESIARVIKVLHPEVKGKCLLICSAGGHFYTMRGIRAFLGNVKWITFKNSITERELSTQEVCWAYSPTNRNIPNLIRNMSLAMSELSSDKCDIVITTGAGVAVPFVWLAHMRGKPTVFVESITRVDEVSLSAKLLLRLGAIDTLIVQSPNLLAKYPDAHLVT